MVANHRTRIYHCSRHEYGSGSYGNVLANNCQGVNNGNKLKVREYLGNSVDHFPSCPIVPYSDYSPVNVKFLD